MNLLNGRDSRRGRKATKIVLNDCIRAVLWDDEKKVAYLRLTGRNQDDHNRIIELMSDGMDGKQLKIFISSLAEVQRTLEQSEKIS